MTKKLNHFIRLKNETQGNMILVAARHGSLDAPLVQKLERKLKDDLKFIDREMTRELSRIEGDMAA